MTGAPDPAPRLRWSHLAWLASLYVVQGLPFGFQATALPAYFRAAGVSFTEIALLDLLALPWMLKALWAPLVDRVHSRKLGRRRSWILPMQLLLSLICFAATQATPERSIALLLGLVASANLVAATLDVAVDGLAVDLLDEKHLGLGNTAQVVGFKVGMLVGGGLLVWLSQWTGWPGLFAIMGAMVLIALGGSLVAKEPPPRARPDEEEGDEGSEPPPFFRLLRKTLFGPTTWRLALVVATYKLGEKMADAVWGPWIIDTGRAPETLGLWLGTWGMACSLTGSLVGGLLALRLPLYRALLLTASLRMVPHALQWWLAARGDPSDAALIAVSCAESFFGGALTTVMFAFMMSKVDRRIGATHYTVLASVEVIGKMPAGPAAGLVADHLGVPLVFACATVLSVLYLPLLAFFGRALARPKTPA